MSVSSKLHSVPDEMSTALRVAFIYLVIGSAWILLSDWALARLAQEGLQLAWLQTAKGWMFILVTSVLLFAVYRRHLRKSRQNEETYRSLVENSLTGISIIQNDTHVYQNPEQERMLGPLPRPMILKDLTSIHPEDTSKVGSFYEDIASGKFQKLETEFRCYPEGNRQDRSKMRRVICRANRITYDGREAILANIMDVTRTRELERAVRIQDKMSSLGRVAAGFAHEIRNPLSGINIYLSSLKRIFDKAENLDKVGGILEQLFAASLKIESVIKRVMDFSKPTEPKVVVTDMNGPVSDAIDLVAVTLRKSGIDLMQDLSPDLPPCRLDVQMIEEVVLNLINNASEALRTAEGDKRVAIKSFAAAGRVRVTVSDSGPGIADESKSQVFDPFYTTKPDGTGIGLSICQRIIADHGGVLTVGDSAWGGARFELAIPIGEESS